MIREPLLVDIVTLGYSLLLCIMLTFVDVLNINLGVTYVTFCYLFKWVICYALLRFLQGNMIIIFSRKC